MNDKIQFVKWMFKNINYWYVFFTFHLIACVSLVFLPAPYDKIDAVYVLTSVAIATIYCFIVMPLKWAYIEFKKQQTL